MDMPCVNGIPNPDSIQENNLNPTLHTVKLVDTIFLYTIKRSVSAKRHIIFSLLNTY